MAAELAAGVAAPANGTSLRARLLLLIVLCVAPGFGFLAYDYHHQVRREVDSAKEGLMARAEEVAGLIEQEISRTSAILRSLAEVPAVSTLAGGSCSNMLRTLFGNVRPYNIVFGIRPDGEYVCTSLATPPGGNRADRDYFKRALRSEGPVVGEPILGRANNSAGLPIAYAVRDKSHRITSVLGATLNGNAYVHPLVRGANGKNLSVIWWNRDARIAVRWPDPARWMGKAFDDPGIAAMLAAQAKGSFIAVDVDGVQRVFGFASVRTLQDEPLRLGLGVSYESVIRAHREDFAQRASVLAILMLLFGAGGWVFAEVRIRRPISALSRVSEAFAGGDLAIRVPETAFKGEMLALAQGFNRMAKEVEQTVGALRASEERFRLLVDGFRDYAIYWVDPFGHVTSWNDGARRLKGYDSSEILGRHIECFYPPEETMLGTPRAFLERAAAEGTAQNEGWRVRKDGTRFYANVVVTAIRKPSGELIGFAKIVRDVTEGRRAESRIRTQLEHLRLLDQITRSIGERQDLTSIFQVAVRSLEDSLPVDFGCICLHDAVANQLRVSCVGAKSEALAHELMMGENAVIDVGANGLARCMQGQLVYEPETPAVQFPFPQRLARGGLRSVVMAPLRSESRVFGVLVIGRRAGSGFESMECEFVRQLSEHVALAARHAQLYESLHKAYDDLRQTQQAVMQQERLRALGQMASGIAHDINNALSPVSLYTESMLETEKNLSDRARRYLETILRAVEDVAHTVARMREFYRQREQQLELAPVEPNRLVRQVLDLTQARWRDMVQSRGVVIEVETALASELPRIMGAESEIREALTNLVFNAVDAMPEGGALSLRTRLVRGDGGTADAVAIEVADTGIGMDEETRRRCLEPFFTTKGERGTGLGLAMVFGMAQRHSCELEIDSTPGAGTTVRLVFAVPERIAAKAAPAEPMVKLSRLRLLIVDDDPVLVKSLRDALELDGHQVVAANGGQAGIDEFRAAVERGAPYAAVITDLGMPYVDGRKVAVAVKGASAATPVIMLTGWGQRMVVDGEIPPHVDRVLSKPPKMREVREALAHLCGRRQG